MTNMSVSKKICGQRLKKWQEENNDEDVSLWQPNLISSLHVERKILWTSHSIPSADYRLSHDFWFLVYNIREVHVQRAT